MISRRLHLKCSGRTAAVGAGPRPPPRGPQESTRPRILKRREKPAGPGGPRSGGASPRPLAPAPPPAGHLLRADWLPRCARRRAPPRRRPRLTPAVRARLPQLRWNRGRPPGRGAAASSSARAPGVGEAGECGRRSRARGGFARVGRRPRPARPGLSVRRGPRVTRRPAGQGPPPPPPDPPASSGRRWP